MSTNRAYHALVQPVKVDKTCENVVLIILWFTFFVELIRLWCEY